MNQKTYSFEPDYGVAPGETLSETLAALGLTAHALAQRVGLSGSVIAGILDGREPITADIAGKLERGTGVPGSLWSNLEAQYRRQMDKLSRDRG